ncbi:UvrD-helicase domain-containing protein [Candidatus Viadribacter manganicus]|nr:UvrD-helicase domain-containing protein [Candidatus Viadribacter manganicus]
MPQPRPYLSYSAVELEDVAEETSDAACLRAILNELAFRSTQKARNLETQLKARLERLSGGAPEAPRTGIVVSLPVSTASSRSPRGGEVPPPAFAPTDEQSAALEKFKSGESLKISAFAGSGKTSTLQLMAAARPRRGLYLAFNKKIANEAASRFPSNVDCRTTHSVAARAIRSQHAYSKDKMFTRIGAMQLAAELELKPRIFGDAMKLTPPQQAFLFQATLRRFCQSSAPVVDSSHVVAAQRFLGLPPDVQIEARRWVLAEAQALWKRMTSAADALPLGHDGYLKLWALGQPRLDYDYILLDEAQDTNFVVLDVLTSQPAQMVYVGDRYQQIYEWRGAVNAMEKIETAHEAALTQSFRFGDTIASAASAVLRGLGESRPIRGNPKRTSRILDFGEADAVLARTNAAVMAEALGALSSNKRPFIVGGTDELKRLVGDVFSLMEGNPGTHPDFFGFKNWDEVVEFAQAEEGEDLKPFVTLVQIHGPRALWAAIANAVSEEAGADICLSTAHKAKGCEWPSVRLADDFSAQLDEGGSVPESEARLFYVAMTRAKDTLVVDPQLLAAFKSGVPNRRDGSRHGGAQWAEGLF